MKAIPGRSCWRCRSPAGEWVDVCRCLQVQGSSGGRLVDLFCWCLHVVTQSLIFGSSCNSIMLHTPMRTTQRCHNSRSWRFSWSCRSSHGVQMLQSCVETQQNRQSCCQHCHSGKLSKDQQGKLCVVFLGEMVSTFNC